MIRHKTLLLSLILALCLVLPACALTPASSMSQPPQETSTGPVITAHDLLAGTKAAREISRFSDQLFFSSLANADNVLISPTSVFLALAMTSNGAASTTEKAMLDLLAGRESTVAELNATARSWLDQLDKVQDKELQLKVANSIWLRNDFPAAEKFLQDNAAFYAADTRELDFASPAAPKEINSWVEENTNGLIKEMVSQIDPSTVMFLINTLYFKAQWQEPFAKEETYKRSFYGPGPAVEVDFMHQTGSLACFTTDSGRGVYLPYGGGRFAYFAILPDQDLDPVSWMEKQGETDFFASLSSWMAQAEKRQVMLALPRYKASYEDSLVDELEALGMALAFDGGRADFSRLVAAGSKGLYISEVKHKTFISVDEKGTEAAAATSVAIDESAALIDDTDKLVFDRPFVYGIMDLSLGLPLFAGILTDPLAE